MNDQPADAGQLPPRSGLRNPPAAARAMGIAALALEAVVLLLALQPMRQLAHTSNVTSLLVVGVLVLSCVLGTGVLRFSWGWRGIFAVQGAIIAAGYVHWSLAVIGLVFAVIWAYVLSVRRTILSH